jgi:hypothetical protein
VIGTLLTGSKGRTRQGASPWCIEGDEGRRKTRVKGKGPKHERETVINFNEEETTASVWTASETVYRQLKRRGYVPTEDRERSATFEVPKGLVKVLRPKRQLTEQEQERLRERGRQVGKGRFISRSKEISLSGEVQTAEKG